MENQEIDYVYRNFVYYKSTTLSVFATTDRSFSVAHQCRTVAYSMWSRPAQGCPNEEDIVHIRGLSSCYNSVWRDEVMCPYKANSFCPLVVTKALYKLAEALNPPAFPPL